MSNLIGYKTYSQGMFWGDTGLAYDYIMAGTGLFVQAENQHISARVPEAAVPIRGLDALDPRMTLKHGRIPQRLFDLALSVMLASPERERCVGIMWRNGYQPYVPEQESTATKIDYATAENVVAELHSHPNMPARFSGIDNKDETGLKIYGVVGFMWAGVSANDASQIKAVVNLRVGVYGYFMPVRWSDVFEGSLQGAMDYADRESLKEGTSEEL